MPRIHFLGGLRVPPIHVPFEEVDFVPLGLGVRSLHCRRDALVGGQGAGVGDEAGNVAKGRRLSTGSPELICPKFV